MTPCPDVTWIVLAIRSTILDHMYRSIRAGVELYEDNVTMAGNVGHGCFNHRTTATNVPVFTSMSIGRRRPTLSRLLNQIMACQSSSQRRMKMNNLCTYPSVSLHWTLICYHQLTDSVSFVCDLKYLLSQRYSLWRMRRWMSLECVTTFLSWRITNWNKINPYEFHLSVMA